MTLVEIIDAISKLGFPVVMCGALFYYMVYQRKEHVKETDKLRESINNNTTAIMLLTKLIEGSKNEKK